MRNEITTKNSWTENRFGPANEDSAEVRGIARRGERAFRAFVLAWLFIFLLVLLAMRAASATADNTTASLRLNFHGASLDRVLDYLSDAAGFVIDKQTEVRGTLEVWSKEPVSQEEAVQLLNAALKKNGCAVLRSGRKLTIVSAERARTSDLEVLTGSDPAQVERSDETVTQLVPVRYASASQLLNNLQGLLPGSATLTVNDSANTLILVATKSEIRRMLKIISALDSALAATSSIQVFSLRHADAKDLATTLPQIFSQTGGQNSRGQSSSTQNFDMQGPGGFGPPGMPGGPEAPSGSGNAASASTSPKVIAVADERSNSLVVSAPSDLLPLVSKVLRQLDEPTTGNTELRVFRLKHADANELATQLAELFPDSSSRRSDQDEGPAFFGGPPPPPGAAQDTESVSDASSAAGSQKLKQSRVLAIADPRTSSLIVSAGSALMPQVAALVTQLDSIPARNEAVQVWELRNADPQDVNQILQDLFNRNNVSRNNNNNANSMLGQNNPLTARQTKSQASTSTTGNFGSGNSGLGGGTQSRPSGL